VTGLDTNVLVRYLTEDDPVQSPKAAAWIRTATSRGERCYISPIVLCELAWVLRYAYGVDKSDLLLTFQQLMSTTQFVIGNKDVVREAIDAYRSGKGDFADYVIGAIHKDAGCTKTATFDRRLRGSATFQTL
jgi:predicted nucleic-acid-binding protein